MNIEEPLNRLRGAKTVCVDVETSGLSWLKNFICGYVLTFGPAPQDSYYLPVRHKAGGNVVDVPRPSHKEDWDGRVHPLEQEIVKGLDRCPRVFGHNLVFDLKFLYRVGLDFQSYYEDTIINAALLNEWQSSFSLEYCTKAADVFQKKTTIYEHIAEQIPEARGQAKGAMGFYWQLAGDDPVAVDYACSDGTGTWQLRDWQNERLATEGLLRVHDIECKTIPVLARMSTRGIKIDVDQLHQVKYELEQKREAALQALPDGFNSRSPAMVRRLMEEHGHTDWPMTAPTKHHPQGSPSFSEAWLLTKEIGRQIIAVRKFENLLNSFIEPMIETHLQNGRCYPEYNQLRGDEYGTVTGRLSSSNPNLQQVNKRNKELGRYHRSIFIPDEGMLWGSVDWSQMEPRLLAYYSRCKVLFDGYHADPPIDAHSAVAKAAGMDREDGKRMNQAILTGAGKKKLMKTWGKTEEEIDKIWDDYFAAMPEIRVIQKRAERAMRDRGYVLTLLQRKARLHDPSKAYVALNRLLQGGNADAIKVKMVEIDAYYRSEGDVVNLLSNCHDALEHQFHPEHEHIYKEACRIMTSFGKDDVITLDVPITIEGKTGRNWAVATWGEEENAVH